MKNSYFLCLQYQAEPIAWDPASSPQGRTVHERYFGEVFQAFERHLDAEGLTIYLTWDLDTLPSYGSDVVAVVMGDEWARVPHYSHKVLATFKCYGTNLSLGANPLLHPSRLNLLAAAKSLRDQLYRLPGLWARLSAGLRAGSFEALPPIFPIPLGYANQHDLPIKPFSERTNDIQFAGSISHNDEEHGVKRWIESPKVVSRRQMLDHLTAYQQTHPDVTMDLFVTDGFGPHAAEWGADHFQKMRDAETYSTTLMDTRICLVPRGTSLETFRFFEGLRAGCVLIAERLPSRWFYDDAPVLTLDDWSELSDVLDTLLQNPNALRERHRASLHWWESVCSEEAVGRYMAHTLASLSSVPADADVRRPRTSSPLQQSASSFPV